MSNANFAQLQAPQNFPPQQIMPNQMYMQMPVSVNSLGSRPGNWGRRQAP